VYLVRLELLTEVQDVDRVKGTDLDADPAAYAELFGDEGYRVSSEDYALLPVDVDRALLDAFKAALLRLA